MLGERERERQAESGGTRALSSHPVRWEPASKYGEGGWMHIGQPGTWVHGLPAGPLLHVWVLPSPFHFKAWMQVSRHRPRVWIGNLGS